MLYIQVAAAEQRSGIDGPHLAFLNCRRTRIPFLCAVYSTAAKHGSTAAACRKRDLMAHSRMLYTLNSTAALHCGSRGEAWSGLSSWRRRA